MGRCARRSGTDPARHGGPLRRGATLNELEIVELGWATTVQDAGRPGWATIGVPESGALDRPRRALVNRLVGNAVDAAVVETAGRLRLRPHRPCVVATSTELAPRAIDAGDIVAVDPGPDALWAYLAVRGGFAVDVVLGSRSQDVLSGIGPSPLSAGQRLPVGPDPGTPIVVDQVPPPVARGGPIGVWPGPRIDWFAAGVLDRLTAASWVLSPNVSRVGARLEGPPLARLIHDELASEGLLTGAVQVPADGQPVVMLADHPTTGGYPVVAIVDAADLARLAQTRPGATVWFRLLH